MKKKNEKKGIRRGNDFEEGRDLSEREREREREREKERKKEREVLKEERRRKLP